MKHIKVKEERRALAQMKQSDRKLMTAVNAVLGDDDGDDACDGDGDEDCDNQYHEY